MLRPYPSPKSALKREMIEVEYKWPVILAALMIAVLLAYGALTMDDKSETKAYIDNTIPDLPQDLGQAEQQPQDLTPIQKFDDAVKDTGDNIKDPP